MKVRRVEISRPEKELFPGGVTKADLARYYDAVADRMLPHVRDRVVTMQRYPDGVEGEGFYEKKAPDHFPDWVETCRVRAGRATQEQVVIHDGRTLVLLADQACITPHVWLSRTAHLESPDLLVLDLDPSDDDLAKIRRATRMAGELLDELGLPAFLKTTGSRGYHVVVPLRGRPGFDEVRSFARRVGELLADREPDLLTVEQRKDRRGDRVLVDYVRNAYGQTVVPPYAVRARPQPSVATPIPWDELSSVRPDQFTIDRPREGDDPWKGMGRHGTGLAKPRERLERLTG